MKKISLPAPPQPSFSQGSVLNQDRFAAHDSRGTEQHSASKRLAPLDAAFLRRIHGTTLWFGALMSFCALAATRSIAVGMSFAIGALLSLILLKSQEMFVRRVVRPKNAPPYQGWDARFPIGLLLPLKYSAVSIGIYCALRSSWFVPAAFAVGFTVVQVVIVARVVGRLLAHNVRTVREVYGQGSLDAR